MQPTTKAACHAAFKRLIGRFRYTPQPGEKAEWKTHLHELMPGGVWREGHKWYGDCDVFAVTAADYLCAHNPVLLIYTPRGKTVAHMVCAVPCGAVWLVLDNQATAAYTISTLKGYTLQNSLAHAFINRTNGRVTFLKPWQRLA